MLRLSASRRPFWRLPDERFEAHCVARPAWDRMLATTFRSPATAPAFTRSIPGSTLPACHFASRLTVSAARSAFPLPYRLRLAPVQTGSMLQARCSLYGSFKDRASSLHSPWGRFQVIRFPALFTTGMHGTEHRNRERRTPRLSAPRLPFSPVAGSVL